MLDRQEKNKKQQKKDKKKDSKPTAAEKKQANFLVSAKDMTEGVFQLAEKRDLKSRQCGFESHHPYLHPIQLIGS